MFVRNSTRLDVALARGRLNDDIALGAVVVTQLLRIEDSGLSPLAEPLPPSDSDPPAQLTRLVLWRDVSVTAAGVALSPAAPPFVCPVLFRIGAVERRLIVFGDRRWKRRLGGGLEATPPAPFGPTELSFERAFGGAYDLPPGLLPGTDLPHPGLRVAYPWNPRGVGFYPDERAAEGAPLPNIELPDQLVRHWNDAPEPAGFTPCKDLTAWRMKDEGALLAQRQSASGAASPPPVVVPSLRIQHHAPPSLIFDDLPVGTPIELHGLRYGSLRFVVPPSPASVSLRGRGSRTDTVIGPRLRALHLDAERRAVRLFYDHPFRYDPRHAPSWIRIA